MTNVYVECPVYENNKYKLRLVAIEDSTDLLKVYSDKASVPFFNSDNCNGDDFYYQTQSRMKEAIEFWLFEYQRHGFVRWSIEDKFANEVIGTIELFHRDGNDFFTNCGLLRLDLRSDYENKQEIKSIISLILEPAYELFDCDKVATKAVPDATERRKALEELGFIMSNEKLVGHEGIQYGSYFVVGK